MNPPDSHKNLRVGITYILNYKTSEVQRINWLPIILSLIRKVNFITWLLFCDMYKVSHMLYTHNKVLGAQYADKSNIIYIL